MHEFCLQMPAWHQATPLPLSQSSQFEGPRCLHTIFERVANRFPDNVAVTDDNEQLTYRELNKRAETLANTLRQSGVQPDQLVGLCLERGCDLIVGVLGILKAGGAYVPIDPAYPTERCAHVLAISNVKTVVASTVTAALMTDCRVVNIDALTDGASAAVYAVSAADEHSLSYVIFTSGSSGQPKGVMIEHGNVVRLFMTTDAVFGFTENDVWCNFHSIAFDFAVWEIWGALLFGGRLVMVSHEVARDPQAFLQLLVREKVTVLNQTPSSFRNLLVADAGTMAANEALSLRYVIFGGERLDYRSLIPWVARHGLDKPSLINMYGITETTVHVTWKRIGAADLVAEGPSPIGEPLSDLKIDIVDGEGNSLPPGSEGLIYVSGAGLARGYLNRPDLTQERFSYRGNREGKHERWYNSGDVGVQIGPNAFAYVGRADRQLKIRGYRIEPGEIEDCLKKNPGVQDCIVMAADFEEGDPRLVAYLVVNVAVASCDHQALINELQATVAKTLPRFMTPSTYLLVEKIPTTVNGKQDDAALLQILQDKLANASAHTTPKADVSIEEHVRSIWSNILGADSISDDTEFFDLGGTSFSLIQMLQLVNERFQIGLRIDVFSHVANISTLVKAIRNQLGRPTVP